MENDSIRSSGSNTLVEIWVNGALRGITVTRQAIDAFVGQSAGDDMTDEDRCEFVRTHLPLVVTAAKARLRETPHDVENVTSRMPGSWEAVHPSAAKESAGRSSVQRKVCRTGKAAQRPAKGRSRGPEWSCPLGGLAVLSLFGLLQDVIGGLNLLEALDGFASPRLASGWVSLTRRRWAALIA